VGKKLRKEDKQGCRENLTKVAQGNFMLGKNPFFF
jgi:hypothetical protein